MNNSDRFKDDLPTYNFKYASHLESLPFFQWYKKYFYNQKGGFIFSIIAMLTPLLFFIALIVNKHYLLPNENSLIFSGLYKQIYQLINYGYENQAKEWATFVLICFFNFCIFIATLLICMWPRYINLIIKAWVYHIEDRNYFLTKKGMRYWVNDFIVYIFVCLGIMGGWGVLIFFSVDDPSYRDSLYNYQPGATLLPYILIMIGYLCSLWSFALLLNFIIFQSPCLIIGRFRYKTYERKMREGKVEYAKQSFYEEEMQENITPPPKPKDKWDNYDGLWND